MAGYRNWLHHFKETIDYLTWRGRMTQARVGEQDDTHEHLDYAISMMSDVAERLNDLLQSLAEPSPGGDAPAQPTQPASPARLLQAVDSFIQQEQGNIAQIPQVGRRTAAANLIRDAANYFRGSREALQHVLRGLNSIQFQ